MNTSLGETSECQERELKHSNKDNNFWKWKFDRKSEVYMIKVTDCKHYNLGYLLYFTNSFREISWTSTANCMA